jgi:hypothetical protein
MIDIHPGAQVYARHGRYVGVVEAASEGLIRVRTLEPIGRVFYVPQSAVIGCLPGGREIFLACTCEELASKGWLYPPHGLPEGRGETYTH